MGIPDCRGLDAPSATWRPRGNAMAWAAGREAGGTLQRSTRTGGIRSFDWCGEADSYGCEGRIAPRGLPLSASDDGPACPPRGTGMLRMSDGIVRLAIGLAGPIFWLALLDSSAHAQEMGLGSGPDASGPAEPRGSAVNLGGSETGSSAVGGLEGGAGRRSGTAGSPIRGRTQGDPGDPDDTRLTPIGA